MNQFNHNRGQKSVALYALGAAMFAVGVSLSAAACNGTDKVETLELTKPQDSAAVQRSQVILTGTQQELAPKPVVTAAPATSAVRSAPSTTQKPASTDTPTVKRFVVAERIEQREPVAATEFTLGSAPIYAFAEFDNRAGAEQGVRITFEKDTATTVGFVELTVPAAQQRWRTWGHTRLIREPGRWTAVLRTSSGEELARAEFDVKTGA